MLHTVFGGRCRFEADAQVFVYEWVLRLRPGGVEGTKLTRGISVRHFDDSRLGTCGSRPWELCVIESTRCELASQRLCSLRTSRSQRPNQVRAAKKIQRASVCAVALSGGRWGLGGLKDKLFTHLVHRALHTWTDSPPRKPKTRV